MAYDGALAADYADRHAEPRSVGQCATYVRLAIAWGGISIPLTHHAKDFGAMLVAAGFHEVTGTPQKGDVVVIQPAPGNPDGHAAIYDGNHWISDFRQLHGLYPGPAYRNAQSSYKIYRY